MTGVIGVTAVAGLGVVLAVLSGQAPAPPPARPVAVDLGAAATPARPVPGSPAADPFFPPETAPLGRASERPETEPERATEHREETGEAVTRDGAENNSGNGPEKGQPAKEQPVREQRASRRGAPPPGREIESSRSSRRPAPTAGPSSSSRGGGGDSTDGRPGTGEVRRPRPARMAPQDARQQSARGSASDAPAAETTKAETTASKSAASKDTDPSGAASTRVEDPCLQFDDELRRAYCYEVLRALGQ
ncbi:hypothetical protein [Microbispora hainanensis]|uniref:Uncharacterized protein n=1 Tax=Microbispora hainanensis TaxID=568844 RepID=A0A544YN34_9ACTN|nr:hypothetical protein [Microbispora hainanensis]TQS18198.1 hypothetical protein FLX08_25690 [Microbispora hainanensis]